MKRIHVKIYIFSCIKIKTKQKVRLGTPLPGYTGTQKRIVASNIFG